MIEVIHFRNRFGKQMCGVLETDSTIPESYPGNEYAKRYAAGLEAPFYPLPAIPMRVFIGSILVAIIDPYTKDHGVEYYHD